MSRKAGQRPRSEEGRRSSRRASGGRASSQGRASGSPRAGTTGRSSRKSTSRAAKKSSSRRGRRPQPPGPLRWGAKALSAVFLLAVLGWLGLFAWGFLPASQPGPPIAVEVRGEDVAGELAEAGLLDSPRAFSLYRAAVAPWVKVVPRTHLLAGGLSPRKLVRFLGESSGRPQVRVAIPEGFDRYRIAERLEQLGVTARQSFVAATEDRSLLDRLGLGAASAEGYLFPATYQWPMDADPRWVVQRMVREAQKRFDAVAADVPERPAVHAQLDLSRHQLVTLASIVEKETARPDERPRIARVFLNRLAAPEGETKGLLQSDPTAAYACRGPASPASCSSYSGTVTPALLRDAENTYNTYRNPGLPPGPICNPGEAAFRAVLAPADGAWLYFVASGSGGHHFSETFEGHKKAVKRLRERRGPASAGDPKNPD